MAVTWDARISDDSERKVFEALADDTWDFRTLEVISRDTGVPEHEVRKVIAKYPDLIRKSLVPDRQGQALFTLRSRPIKPREHLAQMYKYMTKLLN